MPQSESSWFPWCNSLLETFAGRYIQPPVGNSLECRILLSARPPKVIETTFGIIDIRVIAPIPMLVVSHRLLCMMRQIPESEP